MSPWQESECILSTDLGAGPDEIQGGCNAREEGGQVVLRILLPDAVVRAVTKDQEVGRKLDVLPALRAKTVGVELVRVLIALGGVQDRFRWKGT